MVVPEGASVRSLRANLRPGRAVLGGIVLLFLLAMLLYLWSGKQRPAPSISPTATQAKYEQIQQGLTYEEVRGIIGAPGEELSRSDIAGYQTVMYSWKNANGSNNPPTSFTDVNVPAGTYTYSVRATDAANNDSAAVNSNDVTALDNPATPPAGVPVSEPPAGTHSIIGFPERDFISADGYTDATTVDVQIIRGTNIVAFGPRIVDEGSYAELELRREDKWTEHVKGRVVATLALFPPFFHFWGNPTQAIAIRKNAGTAWWGLSEIKTQRFSDEDLDELRRALALPGASEDDMAAMGFTLARALDDRAQYADSLAALEQANARIRARKRWDARVYSEHIGHVLDAFTPPPAGALDATLGHEAIFIASMPRSGSTLTEQVLASHSQVDGGGEVADLPAVLMEECQRLNMGFPQFVQRLTPGDWARLGQRYLQRTKRWRGTRARFTDKMPGNWQYAGAIRAMLPGAHIVICRRDPLETCLSCYRQHFAGNDYTRTFEDLGAYWHDFDRSARRAAARAPAHVREHVYETLQREPEREIRALLDFCGLPFEAACLEFHRTRRSVGSPSAMQVREPLKRDTARAGRYGALLDPLRRALGLAPFAGASG